MTAADHEQAAGDFHALAGLLPLFRELNGLKRLHVAGEPGSWAERLFLRSWERLAAGEDTGVVAHEETARAVVAALLAGIDAGVLATGNVPPPARLDILQRAFDTAASPVASALAATLRDTLSAEPWQERAAPLPACLRLLAAQPRAGATRPGHPRVVLAPVENHAEHCATVAVNGVLAAGAIGADCAGPFLTGLAHHLHNAFLPDAGDAGDTLLGEYQRTLLETFREQALGELPAFLQEPVRRSLTAVYRADTPEARAFQAADSVDRVLEMEWHARSAAFTLDVALGEMDIIHPGPVQAFQLGVMRALRWK